MRNYSVTDHIISKYNLEKSTNEWRDSHLFVDLSRKCHHIFISNSIITLINKHFIIIK